MKDWGEGSRATIYIAGSDDRAHIFSAEVVNGKVVFVDPQNGKNNVESYFTQQKSQLFGIARVDKLKIGDYIQ